MKIIYINNFSNKNLYSYKNTVFKSNNKVLIGENIKNIGTVVGHLKLKNNLTLQKDNCIITFNNKHNTGIFKILLEDPLQIQELSKNLEYFPKVKDFLERHNNYTNSIVMNEIFNINNEIYNLYNNLRIAECGYTKITDKKDKDSIIQKGYVPINVDDDFFVIESLFSRQENSYVAASKAIAFFAFQCLFMNNKFNIITVAKALGDSQSPVNLYLRNGFVPFKVTKDDIDKHMIKTQKGLRIDPNFAVPMFLPKKILEIIVKNHSYFDEIDKIMLNKI